MSYSGKYNILRFNLNNLFKVFDEGTITINVSKEVAISNVPLSKCLFINSESVSTDNLTTKQFIYFANKVNPTTVEDIIDVDYDGDNAMILFKNENNVDVFLCLQGLTNDDNNLVYEFKQYLDNSPNYGLVWSSSLHIMFKLSDAVDYDSILFDVDENVNIIYRANIVYPDTDHIIQLHNTQQGNMYVCSRVYCIGTNYIDEYYNDIVFATEDTIKLDELIEQYSVDKTISPTVVDLSNDWMALTHMRAYGTHSLFIISSNESTLSLTISKDTSMDVNNLSSFDNNETTTNAFNIVINDGAVLNVANTVSTSTTNCYFRINDGNMHYLGEQMTEFNCPSIYQRVINESVDDAEIQPRRLLSVIGTMSSIQNNLSQLYNMIGSQLDAGRTINNIDGSTNDTGFTIGALSLNTKQWFENLMEPLNSAATYVPIKYDYRVDLSVSDITLNDKRYQQVFVIINNEFYQIACVLSNGVGYLYKNKDNGTFHYIMNNDTLCNDIITESNLITTNSSGLNYNNEQVGYNTTSLKLQDKTAFATTIGDNIYFVHL